MTPLAVLVALYFVALLAVLARKAWSDLHA